MFIMPCQHTDIMCFQMHVPRNLYNYVYVQLFKAFRIIGSSVSVGGICKNIIKQSMHIVNLTCVL